MDMTAYKEIHGKLSEIGQLRGSIRPGGGGTNNYDLLNNIPIVNVTGDDIILSRLETNVYKVIGSYHICDNDATLRISTAGQVFFVDQYNTVCDISPDHIKKYNIQNGNMTEEQYITNVYLDENEYMSRDTMATDEEVRRIFS